MKAFTTGPFTGRHITAILVVFFGVVIAVNVAMARLAISTFGGEVVENSYVASQDFNRWLDEAAKEKALGWSAKAERLRDGRVAITLSGVDPVSSEVDADARHPLGRLPDQNLAFTAKGSRFVSQQALPEGRWRLRIEVKSHNHLWRTEQDVL